MEIALKRGAGDARSHRRPRREQDDLPRARARIVALSKELLACREHERVRLADELHDHMAQPLAAIKINLFRLRAALPGADERAIWSETDEAVAELIAQLRAMSSTLRPPALTELGLESAVRQLLERRLDPASTRWTFDYACLPATLAATLDNAAYRIVRECVANIAAHAGASQVVVEMNDGGNGEELEVIVRDNGRGFDAAAPARRCGSLALLREQVVALGGQFTLDSAPGQGCRVRITLPLGVPACP
jgi:signal transduction histidine kinase